MHSKVIHFQHFNIFCYYFASLIKKLFLAVVFEFVYTPLIAKDKNIPVANELPYKMNLLYRYKKEQIPAHHLAI